MLYEWFGRIVWKSLKTYVNVRWGDRPKQVGVGLLVAGGIGVALAQQRRAQDD
jgi:hypothetical protein